MSLDDALHGLDDALLALDEPDYDEPPEPPPDVHVATARLARLGRLERVLRETERAAEVRKTQIDRFVEHEQARIGREVTWLSESLARYHEAILRLDPDRKTMHLPTGDLVSRMGQAEWLVTDEAAFLSWLKEHHPGIVRRKPPTVHPEEVDRSAMKKALVKRDAKGRKVLAYGIDPETMERPPGLLVREPEREYVPTPTAPEAVGLPDTEIEEDAS